MSFLGVLAAGIVAGSLAGRWLSGSGPGRWLDRMLWLSLLTLLLGMGARIGADPDVLAQAGSIGLRALALAVSAVAGSVALTTAVRRWLS